MDPCPAYLTPPCPRQARGFSGSTYYSIPPLHLHPPSTVHCDPSTSPANHDSAPSRSTETIPALGSDSAPPRLLFICLLASSLQLWACLPSAEQITYSHTPPPLPPFRQSAPSPLEWLHRTVSFELSESVCRVPPRPSIESPAFKRPHLSPARLPTRPGPPTSLRKYEIRPSFDHRDRRRRGCSSLPPPQSDPRPLADPTAKLVLVRIGCPLCFSRLELGR